MTPNQENLTALGKAIKVKSIELGIPHKQLAAEAGTTPVYLSHIMYGRKSGDKYIYKIGQILDIDIDKYIA